MPADGLGVGNENKWNDWIQSLVAEPEVGKTYKANLSLQADGTLRLRGYVAGGGSMLVLGGANGQRLAQSPLATLWPVTPGAARTGPPDP